MTEGKAFYRCTLCGTVVSEWDIKAGDGCPKCGGTKMAPTNLSWWEMSVQLVKHPKFWAWPEDQIQLPPEFPADRRDFYE